MRAFRGSGMFSVRACVELNVALTEGSAAEPKDLGLSLCCRCFGTAEIGFRV